MVLVRSRYRRKGKTENKLAKEACKLCSGEELNKQLDCKYSSRASIYTRRR
jgi:hypothetical protein